MISSHFRLKDVYVRSYVRFRLSRLEQVCQHYRSHPNQLDLFH
jgi:hypothetical protein